MDCFKNLDFFGRKFSFTLLKKKKFQTIPGVILSLCLIAITIIFAINFGDDLYYQKNPLVNSQKVIGDKYYRQLLTDENFLLPWNIQDKNGLWLNTSNILYPTAYHWRVVKNANGEYELINKTKLNFDFCDKKYESLIKGISQYYCFDFKSSDLTFGGDWDGEFIDHVSFELFYCPDEGTYRPNMNCSSFTDLSKYFSNIYFFSLFYPILNYQSDDSENPLHIQYKNYYIPLGMELTKFDLIHFQKVINMDDHGIIFNENKTTSAFYVTEKLTQYQLFSEATFNAGNSISSIYNIDIYLTKDHDYYRRSYMKLQALAAQIGGFINVLVVVCTALSSSLNTSMRDDSILNKIYCFSNDEQGIGIHLISKFEKTDDSRYQVQKDNFFRNNMENLRGQTLSKDVIKPSSNENNLSSNDIFDISIKKIKDKVSLVSFWMLFFTSIFPFLKRFISQQNTRIIESYEIGVLSIEKKLDIIHYLKTLDTVENLKSLILNNQQIYAMDYVKKRNLLDCEQLSDLKKKLDKYDSQKIKTVCDYFKSKIRNKSMNDQDIWIINHLDINFQKFIKE